MNVTARRWRVQPGSAVVEVEAQWRYALTPMARPMATNNTTTQRRDKNRCKKAADGHRCNCDRSKREAQLLV